MEYNDYELVCLAKEGHEEAINLIYKKYKPIVIKKSKDALLLANHHGVDINDIMQEGYIGLDEAIKNFSQNEKATFYTFALLCINRQIVNYLRKITGNRDKLLNNSINLDDSLEQILRDKTDVEHIVLEKETDNYTMNIIRDNLTNFEKDVFDLKLKNYSFEEIANLLNKDIKSIYNTFQRIKFKIRRITDLGND